MTRLLFCSLLALFVAGCGPGGESEKDCADDEALVEVCAKCGPADGCKRRAMSCEPKCTTDADCGTFCDDGVCWNGCG